MQYHVCGPASLTSSAGWRACCSAGPSSSRWQPQHLQAARKALPLFPVACRLVRAAHLQQQQPQELWRLRSAGIQQQAGVRLQP